VRLTVYNVLDQFFAILVDEESQAGRLASDWNSMGDEEQPRWRHVPLRAGDNDLVKAKRLMQLR